ncbi:MAG: 3-deoxy-D-manno-octulosonic acid transferase [Pseudomonadota bacterium]
MTRLFYNLLIHSVIPPALAAFYLPRVLFAKKYRLSFKGKLGILGNDFRPEGLPRPRFWLHAVSVGEVTALGPIAKSLKELLPEASLIVSTGTETGRAMAEAIVPFADGFFYLPLDFPLCVNRVIKRIDPDVLVLMETELWPNLIAALKRRGTAVAVANGRISDRSFPRYRRLRFFFEPVLDKVDMFLMSSALDAERVMAIGAPRDRVSVTGSTKLDAAFETDDQRPVENLRQLLHINPGAMVLVAGSTHPGEHEVCLDVFRSLLGRFPDLTLVLVPRHVERVPLIMAAMKERNMSEPFLRSAADNGEPRNGRNVIVVDRTGELFHIYALATAAFVGGSLVSKGGQNILEPAAWGKVVLFGPHMEDFRDARDILVRAGSGIVVTDARDLETKLAAVLHDPHKTSALGDKGRKAILEHTGSARRNAEMLAELVRPGESLRNRTPKKKP